MLFCLDTIDVDDTLAAEDELSSRTQGSSVVQLEACWSPLLGPMDSSVVHVLSRVASKEALTTAPGARWHPVLVARSASDQRRARPSHAVAAQRRLVPGPLNGGFAV